MKHNNLKIIISGGGTGGHIFPAIAIAKAIQQVQPGADILFVGAQGKMEMEKVPKAGFPIIGLWISGFHRKLTLRNLLFPIKLIASLIKARSIISKFKPDVVVGVGGFASGPLLKTANWAGIPSLIQEQNSYAGVTNKLLAEKAEKVCVAYENMDRYFPKNKIVFTGNPVRADLQEKANKDEAIKHFNLDSKKHTLLVFGGSLGARSINQAMAVNATLLEQNQDRVQVIWQMGKLYYEDMKAETTAQLPNVEIHQFIDRMDLAYAAADIIVCRAGALTIAELSLLGKAAVLVPSPNVAEDHQTKNAQAIVDIEGGIMVKDSVAQTEMLPVALALLENVEERKKYEREIAKIAKPNAAVDIAREVLAIAQKNTETSRR